MSDFEDLPDELKFLEQDGIRFGDGKAQLTFFLPPDIGHEVAAEGDIRQIPRGEIIRTAGIFACIGQQIDGYRVVNEKGGLIDTFLPQDPDGAFVDQFPEELDGPLRIFSWYDFVLPVRTGRYFKRYLDSLDVSLSDFIVAGLIDRREFRSRQLPGRAIHAVKDGRLLDRIVSLT